MRAFAKPSDPCELHLFTPGTVLKAMADGQDQIVDWQLQVAAGLLARVSDRARNPLLCFNCDHAFVAAPKHQASSSQCLATKPWRWRSACRAPPFPAGNEAPDLRPDRFPRARDPERHGMNAHIGDFPSAAVAAAIIAEFERFQFRVVLIPPDGGPR
jgi:hypothetical protein